MSDPEKSNNGQKGIWVLTLLVVTVAAYILARGWKSGKEQSGREKSEAFGMSGEAVARVKINKPPLPDDPEPPTPPGRIPDPGVAPTKPAPVVPDPTEPLPAGVTADLPKAFKVPGIGMELVLVQPGTFLMGSLPDEQHRRRWENRHKVTLTQPYWLGKYEVTQKQWQALGNENQSYFKDPRNPVAKVSWFDAIKFCRELTAQVEKAGSLPEGHVFRLPTEAEWEYACRSGTQTATAFGNDMNSRQANFDGQHPLGKASKGSFQKRVTPVGFYAANAWGLHDMHGNVWEWCHDFFIDLPQTPQTNPFGPRGGRYRVAKGGGWLYHGWECRSTSRCAMMPGVKYNIGIGFRVALARPQSYFRKRE